MGYLINFLAPPSKISNYSEQELRAVLALYEKGLERKLFTIGGFFPIVPFNNIINLYCNLKAFDKADNFIRKWTKKLRLNEQPAMEAFCQAKIAFEKGELENVPALLNKDVQYSISIYELQAHLLSIRCCYLLCQSKGWDKKKSLKPALKRLAYFLSRPQNMGERYIEPARAFLAVMRAIERQPPKAELQKILSEHETVLLKHWLLQQIEELD